MKLQHYYIYILVVILLACHPTYTLQSYEKESITIQIEADSSILNIIKPYKKQIGNQMNEVLTYTKHDLTKGIPQSTIGNFVTDLCLNYTDANICIMNKGGLRTNIDKGHITRGKIYELMPFENKLVVLELNKKDYLQLLEYIVRRGEPFSGIKITINQEGEILNKSFPVNFEDGEKVKIITSDYLANGGDNMQFLKGKKQYNVGIKLRDAIIDYCIKTDTIDVKLDDRIIIRKNE